jgi:hypothetical protein
MIRGLVVVSLLTGLVVVAPSLAAEVAGRIALGAAQTSNIRRAASNEESATIGMASADFSLQEKSRRLNADIAASAQYLRYPSNTYADEVVGIMHGHGTFGFVPNRIEWTVEDNFGQQQLDQAAPLTPENRENINYFSTGPDLTAALGGQTRLVLSGRYSLVDYQRSDFDNHRTGASVALLRQLSDSSAASLNVSSENIRYDNSLANQDFRRQQAYARYDAHAGRTNLSVDAGYNRVTGLGTAFNEALVRVRLARVVSASSTVLLSGGQEISDAGNLLRQLQGLNGQDSNRVEFGTESLQQSNDPFTNRYASARWQFARHRTEFDVGLSRFQELHRTNASLNRVRSQADATLRRNLTPVITASLSVNYARATFDGLDPDYHELTASGAVEWRIGRRLDLRLQYDRFNRNGDVTANDYTENRILLSCGISLDRNQASPNSR